MGYKLILCTSLITILQATVQTLFSGFAIAQYFRLIDFLQKEPILLFIKILYFHNPERSGSIIPVGVIEGISNQAFVLVDEEPFTTTRTYILNCIYLGLCCLWMLCCFILLLTGGIDKYNSRPAVRWPWISVTTVICVTDLIAGVVFINDTFHTKTLSDVMKYIGGTLSGAGGSIVYTTSTAWIMTALYMRVGVFYVLNITLVILVSLSKNASCLQTPAARHQPRPEAHKAQSTVTPQIKIDPPSEPSPTLEANAIIFPKNLLSLPQRVEQMIRQEQKKQAASPGPSTLLAHELSLGRTVIKRPRLKSRYMTSPMSLQNTASPLAYQMGDFNSSDEDLPTIQDTTFIINERPSNRNSK